MSNSYKCQFCGKEHSNASDYFKCVSKCYQVKVDEERKAKAIREEQERIELNKKANEEKKNREKVHQNRLNKISALRTELETLLKQEYDEYPVNRDYDLFGIGDLISNIMNSNFHKTYY